MYDRCATVLLIQYCYGISMNSVHNLRDHLHDNLHVDLYNRPHGHLHDQTTPRILPLAGLLHLLYDFQLHTHLHGVRILFNTMILDI
jgi:hypothetical protein